MRSDTTKGKVEPFNLFGVSSTIWDIGTAQKVVKANSYYFYVIVGFKLFQYLNQVMNNLHTEFERNALLAEALLILGLVMLVRFKMNRVAAILLFSIFIWSFLDAILSAFRTLISQAEFNSLGMIFMGLMIAASYRTVRGTLEYSKFRKNQNTANKHMQTDQHTATRPADR